MTPHVPRAAADAPIAIDAGPARDPSTGVSVYVVQLTRALDELAPGRFVHIGVRRDGPLDREPGDGRRRYLRGRFHSVWLQASADRDAKSAGCSLVHYTNATAPLRATVPFVLTVHDVSLLVRPLEHRLVRLVEVPMLVSAARRARVVIVPSEATAREVRRVLRVRSSRIAVIPHAARPEVGRVGNDDILGSLGLLPQRYVLSVGTIEPRKNHIRLLAAFERLRAMDPDLRLVLVGSWGWRGRGFRDALARSPVRDRVVLTGHVSDDTLAALLRSCAVMAYPSTYEGFGLPVLEAMAVGVPVVTSTASSLPEVAGGAAVLVDPLDVAAIADGLVEAMRRRDGLADAGRARAAGRTWLDVARETMDIYARAQRDRT
jgi:glycosyltransferase involved in cell wall biosynthesis